LNAARIAWQATKGDDIAETVDRPHTRTLVKSSFALPAPEAIDTKFKGSDCPHTQSGSVGVQLFFTK